MARKRIGESHFSAPDTQDEELPIGFMLGIFFAHIPVGGEPYYNFFFDPHKDFFYQFLHSFFAMLNHVQILLPVYSQYRDLRQSPIGFLNHLCTACG